MGKEIDSPQQKIGIIAVFFSLRHFLLGPSLAEYWDLREGVISRKEIVLVCFNRTTSLLRNHMGLNILLDQPFRFQNFHWLDGDLLLGNCFYYHGNKIWNPSEYTETGSSRLKMEMCDIQLLFMHFPHTQSLNLASSYAGIFPRHTFYCVKAFVWMVPSHHDFSDDLVP